MKYEMIFGDERLADKFTNENSVFIVSHDDAYFEFECGSAGVNYVANFATIGDSFYMRRTIKEPKRWTVEDQKAGRLPEVGAELIHKTKGICYFVGVGLVENACWALKLQSGLIYIAEKSWCSPIETPSEKAQREEDEFVESTCRQNEPHSTLYSDGVRAAYRKLKGGE